jgi:tetratricopeptide (TPR) repeat protein
VALRVEVARARKQYDVAVALVRRQLAKRSNDLALWRTLGTLEEEAERPESAIAAYEQVMKLRWQFDPRRRVVQLDGFSTLRLARLLVARKERLDRAHTLLNALDLVIADEEAWALALVRADAFAAEGRTEEAAQALDVALKRLPEDAPADARERIEKARAALG